MCTHASSEWLNGLGIKVHTVNVIGVVDLPLSIGSANFARTACNCLNQYRFHNRFVKITASSASLCHLWTRACRMRHSLAKPRFHRGHIPIIYVSEQLQIKLSGSVSKSKRKKELRLQAPIIMHSLPKVIQIDMGTKVLRPQVCCILTPLLNIFETKQDL